VVSDQITCPTYAGDIASAIFIICNQPSLQGTLHFGSAESVSWYEFAKAIIDEARLHEKFTIDEIKAVTAAEYPTAAKRPRISVLDCQKIKEIYRIDQPSWRDAVIQIVPKLIQEKV
jgi:dTDP-4-dehydrorhamnose reductase